MIFKRKLTTSGMLLGTLFFAFSMTPSLLPRTNIMQGLISGFAFASGYGLGVFGWWLWVYFELPSPNKRIQKIITQIAGSICLLTAVIFLWQASSWQNSLRTLMGLEKTATLRPLVIGLITAAVFIALLLLVKLFRWTFRWLSKRLHQYVPRRISYAFGLLTAIIIFGMAFNGLLFSLILQGADASYKQWDRQIQPNLEQPKNPMKTGSNASLLNWDEIGRSGRDFVAESPDKADLKKFTNDGVQEPIRVYAGIQSGNFEERADLALQELIRVNAFSRSVLVLNTPTGTGWVDPAAIEPIEYLYRGDIATVSAQYSYLPSALSLLFEGEYGEEMAQALFHKVYGYWSELPKDDRPKLYLHGLSLGALNSDRSFDLFDIIDDPFDGVLWSGPPFRSETWKRITAQRMTDSPAWLPRFRDDAVVRFANQNGGLDQGKASWENFRIA